MSMPHLWTRRRALGLARLLLIGVLQATAALLLAVAGSRLLTGGTARFSPEELAAAIAIGTVSLIGLRILQRRWSEDLALTYVTDLRLALMSHVLRTPVNVRSMRLGLVMTRIVNDLTAIKLWIANGLIASLVAAALLGTLLIYLLIMEPVLAAALAPGLLLWGLCLLVSLRPLLSRIRESRRRRGNIAALAGGQLSARLALLTHGALTRSLTRLRKKSMKMNRALVGRATYSGLLRSSSDLVFPVIALTLGLGLLSFDADPLSAYRLGFFFLLLGIVIVQLNALSMAVEYRLAHTVALARLREVFAQSVIEPGSGPERQLTRKAGGRHLKLRHLNLSPATPSFSLDIRAGQAAVLTDLSPEEINRLFAQIAGLSQLQAGRILLDGEDQSQTPPRDWWRCVTVISDALPLIPGTVGENATLGTPSAKDRPAREKILELFGLSPDIAARRISETEPPSPAIAAAIRATRGILRQANVVLVDEAVQRQLHDDGRLAALHESLAAQGVTRLLAPLSGQKSGAKALRYRDPKPALVAEQDR